MEQKPLYYDGSDHIIQKGNSDSSPQKPFEMTDEMRANIGRNPYSLDTDE